MMRQKTQVPPSFTAKKNAILVSLSTPDSAYTDLSPKGSVDEAIRPLIDRINALEGAVTTSSCAGRVSVFLEGKKQGKWREGRGDVQDDDGVEKGTEQAAVPGGKGMGGKWLFVSHEPVRLSEMSKGKESLSQLLGLSSSGAQNEVLSLAEDVDKMRLVRLQFEPMILHIMTASLKHAQPILAAAINAGFRESGIQSLKNLDDPNAFPMVAIRTAGLAFESLVGVASSRRLDDKKDCEEVGEHITRVVSEDYLHFVINIANERFKANAERMQRFEHDLFNRGDGLAQAWEDSKSRQERKRTEGLEQQQVFRKAQMSQDNVQFLATGGDEDIETAGLFGSSLTP